MSPDRQRIVWIAYGSLDQVSGGYIYHRLLVDPIRPRGDSVTCIPVEPGAARTPLPIRAEYEVVVGDELCFRELSGLFRTAPAGVRRVLLIHHLSAWERPEGAERVEILALEKAAIEAAD